MQSRSETGKSIIIFSLSLLICAIPLIFLPLTQDYYDTTKWYAFLIATVCITLTWFFQYIRQSKTMHIAVTPMTVGLTGITLASVVSVIFASPNKIEALLNPLGPVTFFALTLTSLVLPAVLDKPARTHFRWALFGSISLLALISVYQFFGIGKVMLPDVKYLSDPLWTPTGSGIATISLFMIILPLLTGDAITAFREKREIASSFFSIMILTVVAGLGVTLWQFIPKINATLLPQTTGWAITLEILKNLKNAAIGVGAENFLAAFSIGRPVSYNISPLWSVRFINNSNFLFHITTVYGLLGGAAALLYCKSFLTKQFKNPYAVSLYIGLFLLLLTPPTFVVLLGITYIFLLSPHHGHKEVTVSPVHTPAVRYALIAVAVLATGSAMYGLYRTYKAELIFYSSLQSAQANNGTQTYNQQVKAIAANPFISRFHIIYSQTNLALATSLASSINQKDSTATQEEVTKDRQLIAQLVQQSLREAKIAAKLNTSNILAWENLARVYDQLISIAQGADAWADASYKQAIALDPANPVLRLELGSVAMKRKNYTDAITSFQKAAALKPNYANAYYNLANAYKVSGDNASAIRALSQTLELIDKKSTDYTTVKTELDTLKNLEPKPSVTPSPTPAPKAAISPAITLPADSGPNIAP